MCARENEAKIEQYAKKAVQLAIEGRWDEAVTANKQILEISPRDVESCNRLGRAFIELGQYAAAREAYEKTLQSDPYNAIAKKNLKRLSKTGESASKDDHHKVVTDVFIEETGKARVVGLIHMAPKEIIARMAPAEQVDLRVDGQRLIAEDDSKQYLGEIDPKY
ncbi:MAG: tetratricopeptide repeat protein, partial [Chloroflexi bacterium]|nr:tetratricopeptide repeat protein [Chloroflexota bacterium]